VEVFDGYQYIGASFAEIQKQWSECQDRRTAILAYNENHKESKG
jgi:hypothetical protein